MLAPYNQRVTELHHQPAWGLLRLRRTDLRRP